MSAVVMAYSGFGYVGGGAYGEAVRVGPDSRLYAAE